MAAASAVIGFEDRMFVGKAKVLLAANAAAPPHHENDVNRLRHLEAEPDESFREERIAAQLSYGFTPRERTDFAIAATSKYAERLRQGDPSAVVIVERVFLTRDEFKDCWKTARGYHAADTTVDRVEHVFKGRKETFLEQGAAGGKHASNGSPAQLSLEPIEEEHDATDGSRAAAPPDDHERLLLNDDQRTIHLATFVRCCTLDREDISCAPFPLAFARRQRERYKDLVSLIYYIPFLIMFTYFFIDSSPGTSGYFTYKADNDWFIQRLFALPCNDQIACTEMAQHTLNFEGIGNTTSYYQWLTTRVIPQLWSADDAVRGTGPMNNHLFPVGGVRLYQARVSGSFRGWQREQYVTDFKELSTAERNAIDTIFVHNFTTAYPDADSSSKDTSSYQLDALVAANAPADVAGAFSYSGCPENNAPKPYITGKVASYDCGGYSMILAYNRTRSDVLASVQALQQLNWIDRRTRGIFIQKTIFAKNTQTFVTTISGFEISAGGQWVPLRRAYVFKYFTFEGQSGAWLAFFVIYLLFILAYVWNYFAVVIHRLRRTARSLGRGFSDVLHPDIVILFGSSLFRVFCDDPWLLMRFANYVLFLVVWIWRIVLWVGAASEPAYKVHNYAASLSYYAFSQYLIGYLEGANCLLCYLQLFRSFRHFRILEPITRTISKSAYDLYGIAFTGFILLIAFSAAGFVAYSAVLADFATMPLTFTTLLRFLIGDYDLNAWEEARRVISPAYLAALQIFLVIILLDAITAVIADTYAEMVAEEFDVSEVQRVAESDTTCLLTFKHVPLGIRLIFFELKAKALTGIRLILRCCRKVRDEPTTRAQAAYEDSKMDPGLLWKFIKVSMMKVYYGSDAEALEALMDIRELVLIPPSDTPNDITLRAEFTLTMISTDPHTAKKHRTLWDIVCENCGVHRDLYVTLFMYLPMQVASIPLGASVLELIDSKVAWLKSVRASDEVDDAEEHYLTEMAATVKTMQTVHEIQRNATPTTIDLHHASRTKRHTPQQRWVSHLRHIARFRGMPKEAIQALFDKSSSIDATERRITYQRLWEQQHTAWRGEAPHSIDRVFGVDRWDDLHVDEVLQQEAVRAKRMALSLGLTTRQCLRMVERFKDHTHTNGVASMTVEDFAEAYAAVTGNTLDDLRQKAIEEMLVVTGATEIDMDDFEEYARQVQNNTYNRTFALSYFNVSHSKFVNAFALLTYVPFLAFYGYLLFTDFQPNIAYASMSTHGTVNDVFRAPWMRTFKDIREPSHFVTYLKSRVLESTLSTSGGFPQTLGFDMHNFLVGGIKVRQLRAIDQRNCGMPSVTPANAWYAYRQALYFPTTCVPRWSVATQNRDDLPIPANLSDIAAQAFKYDSKASDGKLDGELGYYGYRGHTLFIPASMAVDDAKATVDQVIAGGWLDEHTRALVIDFFMYNWDLNIFTRNQKLFEISAGGSWTPSVRQTGFSLWHSSSVDKVYYFCLVIFFIMLVLSIVVFILGTVADVRAIRQERVCSNFKAFARYVSSDVWWWIMLTNFTLMVGAWALRLAMYGADAASGSAPVRVFNADTYPDSLVWRSEARYALEVMESVNAFLTFVRVFYFVRLHSTLNILSKTLERASRTMFSVLILAFVVLVAFALAGNAVYGTSVESMSSIGKAFSTLTSTFFGSDDFDNWFMADAVFTGIFYALFTIIAVQIMFNMITSVLASAYDEAKANRYDSDPLYRIASVDPTMIDVGTYPLVVQEMRRFVLWITTSRGNDDARRWGVLSNHRTFFAQMNESHRNLEIGSSSASAIAAADLLRDIMVINEVSQRDPDTCVAQAWATASDRIGNFVLFGEPRPRVAEYVRGLLRNLPQEDVLYWCVDLPSRALGASTVGLVHSMLDYNHVWQEQAEMYMRDLDSGDDEEDESLEDKLRTRHNDLRDVCSATLNTFTKTMLPDE